MGFPALKRGNAGIEMVYIIVFLLVFAVAAFVVWGFLSDVASDIHADPDISDSAAEPVTTLENNYPSVFDAGFLAVFAALWLGSVALAFFVDTHPVFFGISVFLLIVTLVVAPIVGNTFEDFSSDSEYSGFRADFPIMGFVMGHVLEFAIVIVASVSVALYAKRRSLS